MDQRNIIEGPRDRGANLNAVVAAVNGGRIGGRRNAGRGGAGRGAGRGGRGDAGAIAPINAPAVHEPVNEEIEVVAEEPVGYLHTKPIKMTWTTSCILTKENFETLMGTFKTNMENEFLAPFLYGVVAKPGANASDAEKLSYRIQANGAWAALSNCATTNFAYIINANRDKPDNERVFLAVQALMNANKCGTDQASKAQMEAKWHEVKMKDDSAAEVKRVVASLLELQQGFALLHSRDPDRTNSKTDDDLKLALERACVLKGELRNLANNSVNRENERFDKMAQDLLNRAELLDKEKPAAEKEESTTEAVNYAGGPRGKGKGKRSFPYHDDGRYNRNGGRGDQRNNGGRGTGRGFGGRGNGGRGGRGYGGGNNNSYNNNNDDSNNGGFRDGRICFNCNRLGHVWANCPWLKLNHVNMAYVAPDNNAADILPYPQYNPPRVNRSF